MFVVIFAGKTFKFFDQLCNSSELTFKTQIFTFLLYLIFIIIFIISFFTLKSDLSCIIFAAVISFLIFLFNLIIFINSKCYFKKKRVGADTSNSEENLAVNQNENHTNNENDINANIPPNIDPRLYELRARLFIDNLVSFDGVYELIDLGFSVDDIIELINYCQDHPESLERFPNSSQLNYLENNPRCKDVFNSLFPINFHFIHIIINLFLSFLSSFSLIYITFHYYSNTLDKIFFAISLGVAHKTLISPIKNELYSSTLDDYENSQTRCFSICIISIGLFFIRKYEIDYLYIDFFVYNLLFFMVFDIALFEGFIGLPRTVVHWFIEFVNRYIFGFSGCSTILYGIVQFLIGSIVTVGCSLFLHFYKNVFWTRTIFYFLSSFICKIELSKEVSISAIIQSIVSSVIFILFNYFLAEEKKYYNIISIVQIGYFFIFEFSLPYLSSISPYLIVYIQFFNSNKILKYIRISLTLVTAPILIGSVLSDDCHYILTSILIVHANNRYLSEPYVFGLGILIARFALYYDFEMKSNLALNLLIGLIISRKFFSVLPLLHFQQKLSIDCTDLLSFISVKRPIIKSLLLYVRSCFFIPTNCLFIPAFIWSFITGAPINFFYLHYLLPLPSPPRCNIFWDRAAEKMDTNEHPVESFVYYSYLDSFRKNLYDLIKKGKFGVVDENSFFLFLEENYTIMVHIVSMNSFSIDFQIRCSEFVRKTLCHAGELGYLNSSSQNDYLRKLNTDDTPNFIQSIFSPVAQNVELNGYHHYPIDIKTSFLSLTHEHKRGWMTYAICFFFSQNEKEFVLSDFFDNPISEININENENENKNKNENKNSNIDNNDQNSNENNNNNDNRQANENNANSNNDDDSSSSSSSTTSDEQSNQNTSIKDGTINYDFKNSYKTLDDEAFSQFEFGDLTNRVQNFINMIYKEVNRQINTPLTFFQKGMKFKFSKHFPLFQNDRPNNDQNANEDKRANNENENISNEHKDDDNDENGSDVEIDNNSDSDQNQNGNNEVANTANKESENKYPTKEKIEWLIKESAKRVYLYWCLAGSYLSPDLEEKGEIRDFLEETEQEYLIIESNSDKWSHYVNLLRDQDKTIKKKKKEQSESASELTDLNEASPSNGLPKCIPQNYFTLFREIEDMCFTFIRKTIMEKWTVFRLHREYVRSIWTSQLHEVIGFDNYNSERLSMQEDNNHLHNLIIQVSELPVEYPAYVSKVEKSVIVL